MPPRPLVHGDGARRLHAVLMETSITKVVPIGGERTAYEFPSKNHSDARWESLSSKSMAGEFFRGLSFDAISDFESTVERSSCPGMTLLISEEEEPERILFLIKGRVKLSINSFDGKRFILGMVGPGEILGLSSAVSGSPYEMRAESHFPCEISSLPRKGFLNFLTRYPAACQNVARQLSRQYKHTYEQLRMLGFALNAPARLARLLLVWCAEGEHTAKGTCIQCPYTHAEIGEHIGVSRETITRCLMDFTTRGLLKRSGTVFTVPDQSALARYSGIGPDPCPPRPAA